MDTDQVKEARVLGSVHSPLSSWHTVDCEACGWCGLVLWIFPAFPSLANFGYPVSFRQGSLTILFDKGAGIRRLNVPRVTDRGL